jgi:hypothetical protein
LQTPYLFLINFLPGPGVILSPGHFPGGTVPPEGLCKIGFSRYRWRSCFPDIVYFPLHSGRFAALIR